MGGGVDAGCFTTPCVRSGEETARLHGDKAPPLCTSLSTVLKARRSPNREGGNMETGAEAAMTADKDS